MSRQLTPFILTGTLYGYSLYTTIEKSVIVTMKFRDINFIQTAYIRGNKTYIHIYMIRQSTSGMNLRIKIRYTVFFFSRSGNFNMDPNIGSRKRSIQHIGMGTDSKSSEKYFILTITDVDLPTL